MVKVRIWLWKGWIEVANSSFLEFFHKMMEKHNIKDSSDNLPILFSLYGSTGFKIGKNIFCFGHM